MYAKDRMTAAEFEKQRAYAESQMAQSCHPEMFGRSTGAMNANMTDAPERAEGEIPAAVSELYASIQYLDELVTRLVQRLQPILSPTTTDIVKNSNTTTRTGLGSSIAEATCRIDRLRTIVNELLSILEL